MFSYPTQVQHGSVVYYICAGGIFKEDLANSFKPFETKYPNDANRLVFTGLCNLQGETTEFRRAEWAYELDCDLACRLCKTRMLQWLREARQREDV